MDELCRWLTLGGIRCVGVVQHLVQYSPDIGCIGVILWSVAVLLNDVHERQTTWVTSL